MLHATQEMLSVARNIGEFIGDKVTWDHVCIWDTWQPWRLLEVSVTVVSERICSLWFGWTGQVMCWDVSLVDLFLYSRSSWVMRDRPLAHLSADLVSDRIYLLYQFMCIFGFEKLVGRKLDFISNICLLIWILIRTFE